MREERERSERRKAPEKEAVESEGREEGESAMVVERTLSERHRPHMPRSRTCVSAREGERGGGGRT